MDPILLQVGASCVLSIIPTYGLRLISRRQTAPFKPVSEGRSSSWLRDFRLPTGISQALK